MSKRFFMALLKQCLFCLDGLDKIIIYLVQTVGLSPDARPSTYQYRRINVDVSIIKSAIISRIRRMPTDIRCFPEAKKRLMRL